MSAPNYYHPAADTEQAAQHDFMINFENHFLDEELPPSHPVSVQIASFPPIFSSYLEYNPSKLSSSSRPLAPRKGSPRREAHIPRPRNAFIIFRSEKSTAEIFDGVEHDHRQISKILGELWRKQTDEQKAPYFLKAQQEKLEHQRKYPGYRFTPGTRTSKPVKRNVKRNGKSDLARCAKVAELLKEGKRGGELESAMQLIDAAEFSGEGDSTADEDSSPSVSPSPTSSGAESLPNVDGWEPMSSDTLDADLPVFRSPLLAPAATVATRLQATHRMPETPIMDSLKAESPSEPYAPQTYPPHPSPMTTLPSELYAPRMYPAHSTPMPTYVPSTPGAQTYDISPPRPSRSHIAPYYSEPSPSIESLNQVRFATNMPRVYPALESNVPAHSIAQAQSMDAYNHAHTYAAPAPYYDHTRPNPPPDLSVQYYHTPPPLVASEGFLMSPARGEAVTFTNPFDPNPMFATPASTFVADPMDPRTWDPMQFINTL